MRLTYMKYQPMRQGQITTLGITCPVFSISVWVLQLTSPAGHVTLKMLETGPTVYSPYLRRLGRVTNCRYNYKGRTFSSVIF